MSDNQQHSTQRKGKRVKQQNRTSSSDLRKAVYDLDLLLEKFISAKLAEGIAKSTLEKYRIVYRNFSRYFELQQLEPDIRNVDVDFARDYVGWLLKDYTKFDGHQYKPDSVKTKGLSSRRHMTM